MQAEQKIVAQLVKKFAFLQERIFVQRQKRIFTLPLVKEEFEQVLPYLHAELGFAKASLVVGTDDGDDLGFIYILSNREGIILALKEKTPKSDPRIKTVTDLFPALALHERELVNLFGAVVEGLPGDSSFPLPDGWPEGSYPMRKDWNPQYFDQETMTYNPPSQEVEKEGGNE
ncbi:MAG: NADH-quinone oxidoreductase subunit C [Firmicutes bacterium]|nr:NADH-quinone oxidoreductase subunit C [Bacillota bacterium]